MDVTVILFLAAFNTLFLAAFVYRRLTDRPPLNGLLAVIAQTLFIAINCMILFPQEIDELLNQLMRRF